MPANETWPREIEVGGGPNIIVESQEEHDAFMEAARRNAEAMKGRKSFTATTVGELLDAGYAVIVTHPDGQRRAAAFGDRTHPCKWELRFNDDESLKGLSAHLTVEFPDADASEEGGA